MTSKTRLTEQKRAIYEYLKSIKTHPTAKEIFHVLKQDFKQLSLATVYRILDSFSRQGLILEIPDLKGRMHYDGFVAPHDHFFCQKCFRLYDLNERTFLGKCHFKKYLPKRGFKINSYLLIFFGKCQNCQHLSKSS